MKLPDGLYATERAMSHDPRPDVRVALIPEGSGGSIRAFLFRFRAKTAR